MKLLRECSTSYSLAQARAMLAAAMQRELTESALQVMCCGLEGLPYIEWGTPRQMAWRLAFAILPGGNETRKKRRAPTPKQRRLPGTE